MTTDSIWAEACPLYNVIPLSVQKEGDFYVVGNADLGEFYQFPLDAVTILTMLQSGQTPASIKAHLAGSQPVPVDVDDFIAQLEAMGFVSREDLPGHASQAPIISRRASGRIFNVDPCVARAIFSLPGSILFVVIVLYAVICAIMDPALRLDFSALYIETDRTLLLIVVLALSVLQTAAHEVGHMLAAAREGVRCRYGIGTRLWTVVAESDLTGILSLPKTKRYLPMLAGLLVDILCLSLLTITLGILLHSEVSGFIVQVFRIMMLETVISMTWQFNIFVKTDIYFVLCNYFSYPDLDRDARAYLRHLLYRVSLGRAGAIAPPGVFDHLTALRIFSLVWVFGRLLSVVMLLTIFMPAMWRYLESAILMLQGPPTSIWVALDTITYVSILLMMLGTGMYMWLKPRLLNRKTSRW